MYAINHTNKHIFLVVLYIQIIEKDLLEMSINYQCTILWHSFIINKFVTHITSYTANNIIYTLIKNLTCIWDRYVGQSLVEYYAIKLSYLL